MATDKMAIDGKSTSSSRGGVGGGGVEAVGGELGCSSVVEERGRERENIDWQTAEQQWPLIH